MVRTVGSCMLGLSCRKGGFGRDFSGKGGWHRNEQRAWIVNKSVTIFARMGVPIYTPKGPNNGEPSISYSVHLLLV